MGPRIQSEDTIPDSQRFPFPLLIPPEVTVAFFSFLHHVFLPSEFEGPPYALDVSKSANRSSLAD